MQHAAEISVGDAADSKIERAKRQRDYFLQQTSAGAYVFTPFLDHPYISQLVTEGLGFVSSKYDVAATINFE